MAGDVVVIRYEGPKGGPGMREMLTPTSAISGMGLSTSVALITDGRFSRRDEGPGHRPRQPGGRRGRTDRARARRATTITIDIDAGTLTLEVADERAGDAPRARGRAPAPRVTSGYLARYARMVSSADTGAVVS